MAEVRIVAPKMSDHAPSDACIRVVVFEAGETTGSRCILDIVELSESTNENKTRKDLLLYIQDKLEDDLVDSLEIQILRR